MKAFLLVFLCSLFLSNAYADDYTLSCKEKVGGATLTVEGFVLHQHYIDHGIKSIFVLDNRCDTITTRFYELEGHYYLEFKSIRDEINSGSYQLVKKSDKPECVDFRGIGEEFEGNGFTVTYLGYKFIFSEGTCDKYRIHRLGPIDIYATKKGSKGKIKILPTSKRKI